MMTAYWFIVRRYWLINIASLVFFLAILGIGVAIGYPGISFFGLMALGLPVGIILVIGGLKRITGLVPGPDEAVLFTEKWASGHSNRNLFTKIGGVRNGLTVQVTEGFIYMRPFLFAAHVADIGGLLHKIPLRSVLQCERQPNSVFLEWDSDEGDESFVLHLRDADEFVRCVDAARGATE